MDDTCRVFPRPRAVLRRKCKALGQQTVISPISPPYLAHISPVALGQQTADAHPCPCPDPDPDPDRRPRTHLPEPYRKPNQADANRTSAEELAARYIMPAKMHALNAALAH